MTMRRKYLGGLRPFPHPIIKIDQCAILKSQLAEARRLLGQMTAINIATARIEQLAEIDGFCVEEAKDVAKHIENCDMWCAEYDKRLGVK